MTKNTDITTTTTTTLPAAVIAKLDEFIDQAASDSQTFLKFSKTGFFAGPEETPVEAGTQFAVMPEGIRAGWKVWKDKQLADEFMVIVLKDGAPPPREAIGHMDESEWEVDDDGRLRDPASKVVEMPLKDIKTGAQYLFTSSSFGGRQAVTNFLMAYRADMAKGVAGYPVVEARVGSYKHRKYGRIYKPELPLICWRTEAELRGGEANMDDVLQDDRIDDLHAAG